MSHTAGGLTGELVHTRKAVASGSIFPPDLSHVAIAGRAAVLSSSTWGTPEQQQQQQQPAAHVSGTGHGMRVILQEKGAWRFQGATTCGEGQDCDSRGPMVPL